MLISWLDRLCRLLGLAIYIDTPERVVALVSIILVVLAVIFVMIPKMVRSQLGQRISYAFLSAVAAVLFAMVVLLLLPKGAPETEASGKDGTTGPSDAAGSSAPAGSAADQAAVAGRSNEGNNRARSPVPGSLAEMLTKRTWRVVNDPECVTRITFEPQATYLVQVSTTGNQVSQINYEYRGAVGGIFIPIVDQDASLEDRVFEVYEARVLLRDSSKYGKAIREYIHCEH